MTLTSELFKEINHNIPQKVSAKSTKNNTVFYLANTLLLGTLKPSCIATLWFLNHSSNLEYSTNWDMKKPVYKVYIPLL